MLSAAQFARRKFPCREVDAPQNYHAPKYTAYAQFPNLTANAQPNSATAALPYHSNYQTNDQKHHTSDSPKQYRRFLAVHFDADRFGADWLLCGFVVWLLVVVVVLVW
jgi:hypothetical protein